MYETLVLVHVLSAVIWIGGVLGLLLMVQDARRREGAAEADRVLARVERLLMVYLAGPFVVLASGITMVAVSDAWSFSQPWVYLALTVVVIGTVVAGSSSGAERKIKAMRASGEVATAAYATLQGRYLRGTWLGTAILAAVEILMVFKPGA